MKTDKNTIKLGLLIVIAIICNIDNLLAQSGDLNKLTIHLVDSVLPVGLTTKICESRWEKLSHREQKMLDKGDFIKNCLRIDTVSGCDCCFDMYSPKVRTKPVITLNDIDSVDWNKQIFYFNPSKFRQIVTDLVPNYGLPESSDSMLTNFGIPCVLKLDNKPKYIIWFILQGSSNGCDLVIAHLPRLYGDGVVTTRFGIKVADYVFGNDPRFDDDIYKILKENRKLTQHNKR